MIRPDALLTLKQACEEFAGGKFSPATLRAEHGRGRLNLFKIGRQHFTTMADLREMQRLCLVPSPVPASGLTKSVKRGASSTAAAQSAQAAAKATFRALRSSSKRTSPHTTL